MPSMGCAADSATDQSDTSLDPVWTLLSAVLGVLLGVPAIIHLVRCTHRQQADTSRAPQVRHSRRARLKTFLFVHTKLGVAPPLVGSGSRPPLGRASRARPEPNKNRLIPPPNPHPTLINFHRSVLGAAAELDVAPVADSLHYGDIHERRASGVVRDRQWRRGLLRLLLLLGLCVRRSQPSHGPWLLAMPDGRSRRAAAFSSTFRRTRCPSSGASCRSPTS